MVLLNQGLASRDPDFLAGKIALAYAAVWPTFWGLLWTWSGLGNDITRFFAVALGALLFLLAAIAASRVPLSGLFAPWQKLCLTVFGCVYIYASVAPTHDTARAIERNVIEAIVLAGAIGFVVFLRAAGAQALRWTFVALIGGMALYTLFLVTHFQLMLGMTNGRWINAFLPFGNVRIFTDLLAPVAVLALGWLAFGTEAALTRRLLLAVWICFAAVLLWTGGRAPVLAICVTLAMAAALGGAEARHRILAPASWGAAIGSAVSLVVPVSDGGFGFWQRLLGPPDAAIQDAVSSGRLEIWRETLDYIAQKPFFGHGTNQWLLQTDLFLPHGSPHNLPLQVLHDYGIVGGGAALALVFGTLWLHLRRFRFASPAYRATILMLCVMVVQSFFDAIFSAFTCLQLVLMAFALAHVAGRISLGQGDGRPLAEG